MESTKIIPWIAVNELMNDNYRGIVVEDAWNHLPKASTDLKKWTRRVFDKSGELQGFRSVLNAPPKLVKRYLIEKFQKHHLVTAAVVCLWAEAHESLIYTFRRAAESSGIRFAPDWDWKNAMEGYISFDKIPELQEFCDSYVQNLKSLDKDHILLATLWLSPSVNLAQAPTEAVLEQVEMPEKIGHAMPKVSTPTPLSAPVTEVVPNSSQLELPIQPLPNNTVESEVRQSPEEVHTIPALAIEEAAEAEDQEASLMTLVEWEAELNQWMEKASKSYQMTVSSTHILLSTVQDGELARVEQNLHIVQDSFRDWQENEAGLRKINQGIITKLISEVTLRSDLSLEIPLGTLSLEANAANVQSSNLAETILLISQKIHHYDEEKQKALCQLDVIRGAIVGFQDEMTIWMMDEKMEGETSLQMVQEGRELNLIQLKELLTEAEVHQAEIEKRLTQFRELCMNRIAGLVSRLRELQIPDATPVNGDHTLGSLFSEDLTILENRRLRALEIALIDLLNAKLTETKSTAITTLASDLRSGWNDAKFVQLLEGLTKANREVETLLLLIATQTVQLRDKPLYLNQLVIGGLLNGLGELSLKSRPFALLSNIAPRLIQGWEASDSASKAELCLVFLAARHGGDYLIPAEILWQVAYEWPLTQMVKWNRLWQAEIMDQRIPIYTQVEGDFESPLQRSRSITDQMFAHEHGLFVRLSSIKSNRHRSMLNAEIMPVIADQLECLQKMDQALNNADSHAMEPLVGKIEKFMNEELPDKLNEGAILELYEKGISKAEINDSESFHRRTSLHYLQECVDCIFNFGHALLEYWRWKIQSQDGVTRAALQSELDVMPGFGSLAHLALEQLVADSGKILPQWDTKRAETNAIQQVEQELLCNPNYMIRLPRIVGYLTSWRLEWKHVLALLLDDLAEPFDSTDAAIYLLENESPNHALFLTQYLPLEIQKQALMLQRQLESSMKQLYDELLQFGGSADDLLLDRDLGRWRLIRRELNERLDRQKGALASQKEQSVDQARRLRSVITELDNKIFEIKDMIPIDAYRLVGQGLDLAKRSCDNERNASHVQTYIDEIRYRLEHESWPLSELQTAFDELHSKVEGESATPEAELTAEMVLDLFERGEFKQLSLSPTDIPASSIGTRIDLLRNWKTLQATQKFLFEDMNVTERNAIQQVFRSFAKMMAMKRTLDPQGQPIIYEHPVIFSYMDLQFPKTAILDNHCVFVALPGEPPSAENIHHLELLLEDKQWLDYFFLFLFSPGCTPKIRARLQTSYRKQGLVIIDEPALLSMVLAEKQERNPLGKLRPMMLSALEADIIDVFKINQLVDSRSSIFVGRDREVERYASREGNYAIYGGRRIGKSSVMRAVEKLLEYRGVSVTYHSFEGQPDCSDDRSAVVLSQLIKLETLVHNCDDFKIALQSFMDTNSTTNLVLLLDEIDRYIEANQTRHVLIETLRSLSERYGSRFKVVISGFMHLYDCLNGRGPYSPASDPWRRMLNDNGPLENLRPAKAEEIVKEGFLDILGWSFVSRAIPQRIVELTGGHPAFVQDFCLKVQQRVGMRGDNLVKIDDIHAVFADRDPEQSFIAYVRKTLEMNLDPIGHYLILLMALESTEKKGFTFDEIFAYANFNGKAIPEKLVLRSLERLKVTSVVKEVTSGVYEFSVPDYPSILIEMGESVHMERLEKELEEYLERVYNSE